MMRHQELLLPLLLLMQLLMMILTLSSWSYCHHFRLSLPAICSAELPSPGLMTGSVDLVPESMLLRLCCSVVAV
uniref:Putative secreted protein n=1 Tax=Anopheles darlingi TaxID=43151 RepID=A0A2M4DRL5_ANODA